ncbi:MAG TPA: hypothetical protein VHV74_00240 [Pseudonocardiaceae bacterium]|jgi:hypothetical protein|nr:hypothetical protein [Pseudonocardiaceae bacterium]
MTMHDPLSVALLAVILVCTPPLVVLLPRDPLLRRWLARRDLRRLRKGVR